MASNAAGAESVIRGGCGLSSKCKAGKYPQGSDNTYSYLDEFPHFESIVEVAGLKTARMALLALGAQDPQCYTPSLIRVCNLINLNTSKIKILIRNSLTTNKSNEKWRHFCLQSKPQGFCAFRITSYIWFHVGLG